MLRLIHHWDIQSFQNISNSELRPAFIGPALILSKSGDGWLYPLTPLFLFLFQAPSAWIFSKVALTAFVIERCIYLIAKNGLRRRRPMAILNGFTSRIIPREAISQDLRDLVSESSGTARQPGLQTQVESRTWAGGF